MVEYNVVVALRPSTGPGGGLADATLTVLPRIDTNPPPCSTRTCSGFRRAAYIRKVPGVVKFKGRASRFSAGTGGPDRDARRA